MIFQGCTGLGGPNLDLPPCIANRSKDGEPTQLRFADAYWIY